MTYRVTTQSALKVLRDLKDNQDVASRQVGSVKQNTIRLGDWVLEAVDDSLVQMTNLVTGEISFIGTETDIPPVIHEREYSYAGEVNPDDDTAGERWRPPVGLTIVSLALTLQTASTTGSNYVVETLVNDVVIRSDTLGVGETVAIIPTAIALDPNSTLYPRLLANPLADGLSMGMVYRWYES